MAPALSRRLADAPLLFAGAMGPLRHGRGASADACLDVVNLRHAEFLHNELPGITIPDPVRAPLQEAGDRALRVGIDMARELVQTIRGRNASGYLMPSFARFEVVAEAPDVLR